MLGCTPEEPEEELAGLNKRVEELSQEEHYKEAIEIAKTVVEKSEHVWGKNHSRVATALNELAGLYQAQGQYTTAEPLYQRALQIREIAFGPDHPEVAESLNNLAVLYHLQGQYARAEPLYQRALRMLEAANEPGPFQGSHFSE